jgi:hypothetical protein
VDAGAFRLHVRAQTGTRIEETAKLVDEVEKAIREAIPPRELKGILDNIGLPISGINLSYSDSGVTGPADADIPGFAPGRSSPDGALHSRSAPAAEPAISRRDLLLSAVGHRHADDQFRTALLLSIFRSSGAISTRIAASPPRSRKKCGTSAGPSMCACSSPGTCSASPLTSIARRPRRWA